MNKISYTALTLVITSLTSPAGAQDWTGFHVGLNAGYLSADDRRSGIGFHFQTETGYPLQTDLGPEGFLGGLEAGYDWQPSDFVFGVAADVQFGSLKKEDVSQGYTANLDNGSLVFAPYPGATTSSSQEIDWLVSLRGRVGHTVLQDTLLYVTGGLAIAEVSYDALQDSPGFPLSFHERKTKVGWTAGVGAEQRLTGDWSLKAEYLYFDLGGREDLIGPPSSGWSAAASFAPLSGHIGRIGVNRRF